MSDLIIGAFGVFIALIPVAIAVMEDYIDGIY